MWSSLHTGALLSLCLLLCSLGIGKVYLLVSEKRDNLVPPAACISSKYRVTRSTKREIGTQDGGYEQRKKEKLIRIFLHTLLPFTRYFLDIPVSQMCTLSMQSSHVEARATQLLFDIEVMLPKVLKSRILTFKLYITIVSKKVNLPTMVIYLNSSASPEVPINSVPHLCAFTCAGYMKFSSCLNVSICVFV